MLAPADTIEAARQGFRWRVPEHFNIGVDICDKWADQAPDRDALMLIDEAGAARRVSYEELRALSNRLANALIARGIEKGDRVAVLLPQGLETAAAHVAIPKMGAVALPLFSLFGPEALAYRLAHSGAKAVITDASGAAKLRTVRAEAPELACILSIDGASDGVACFNEALRAQSDAFQPVLTRADDPAVLIYTSGTTGAPKGALHGHRVLLGHLPGVEMSHDFLGQEGDRIWTPADWAWIGGLFDVLAPALSLGVPVVAKRFAKFSGEAALDLIKSAEIRNAFLPPTALKAMRRTPDAERYGIKMRSVGSGGETLGAELLEWGERVLGVTINEFYGQTECNMVVSSCAALGLNRRGSMGVAAIGHEVAVVGPEGAVLPDGEEGDIAVKRPDPVMFLGYWRNEAATAEKFRGDWLITGDRGLVEEGGFLRFVGRDDDVITSSGYRIGPGEIEDCLIAHPAVQMAAAVGKPDPDRTEIVKAYVVLASGHAPSEQLKSELASHVKTRLAAHEYPREIEFLADLPMTATGKVIRKALRRRAEQENEEAGDG
ncbi:MAG: acyl-CoA synthetase [Neomegalonema sp.]|nr:acyl-CoA synthetase [Neomegalonema sp.]